MSEARASAAQTLASNSKVLGIDVLDKAANVQTNFTGLSGNAKLTGINLSDAGSSMTLSQAQVLSGNTTLTEVKDLYSLNATGVTADSAADLGNDTKVDLIHVEDNANNVALNLAALHALGSKLDNITFTDREPIEITQTQADNYASTLNKILGLKILILFECFCTLCLRVHGFVASRASIKKTTSASMINEKQETILREDASCVDIQTNTCLQTFSYV